MNQELSNFAAHLRERFLVGDDVRSLILRTPNSELRTPKCSEPPHVGTYEKDFSRFALELFALQCKHNAAYRKICAARGLTPGVVEHWTQIPAVPTAAFKELDLTCLAPEERTAVFHSSGTMEQKPSRHFHSATSLKVYEASLWPWFQANVAIGAPSTASARTTSDQKNADSVIGAPSPRQFRLIVLTPPAAHAPHSSLVHMFETVRQKLGAPETSFVGTLAADGSWTLDFAAVVDVLSSVCSDSRSSRGNEAQTASEKQEVRASSRRLPHVPRAANPILVLGTAFSFVHLLDYLAEKNLRFDLPRRFTGDGNRRLQKPFAFDAQDRTAPAPHRTTRRAAVANHLRIRHERVEFTGV